jgi:hypothetical protein
MRFKARKTGQKNGRQKNKDRVRKFFIFLSPIFLSGLPLRDLLILGDIDFVNG